MLYVDVMRFLRRNVIGMRAGPFCVYDQTTALSLGRLCNTMGLSEVLLNFLSSVFYFLTGFFSEIAQVHNQVSYLPVCFLKAAWIFLALRLFEEGFSPAEFVTLHPGVLVTYLFRAFNFRIQGRVPANSEEYARQGRGFLMFLLMKGH